MGTASCGIFGGTNVPRGAIPLPTLSERGYTAPRFVGPVLRANRLDALTEPTGGFDPATELRPVHDEGRPMTTAAPVPTSTTPRPVTAIASGIGLIVAVLCLPVVLLLGGPLNGWILGVVLWSANWWLQLLTAKLAINSSPTAAVGMSGISFISRAWLTAIVLFVIALKYDEQIGLTAAGVFLVAFTCDLAGRTALFAMNQREKKDTPR
jgi:hypothetical protein